jgi:hypothetical protein
MNYIILTKPYKEIKVRVNFDRVSSYAQKEDSNLTTEIVLVDVSNHLLVSETPEEIDTLLLRQKELNDL